MKSTLQSTPPLSTHECLDQLFSMCPTICDMRDLFAMTITFIFHSKISVILCDYEHTCTMHSNFTMSIVLNSSFRVQSNTLCEETRFTLFWRLIILWIHYTNQHVVYTEFVQLVTCTYILSVFFFHTLKSKWLVERGKQNCRFTFSKPACRNEIVDIAGNFHKEYKVGLYVPDLDQKVIIHGVVEKRSP